MHNKQHSRLLGMISHELRRAVFYKRIQEYGADISDGCKVALLKFIGYFVVLGHFGACLVEGFLHIFEYRIIHEAVLRAGLPAARQADLAAVRDIGSASWAFVHCSHLSMYGGRPPSVFLYSIIIPILSQAQNMWLPMVSICGRDHIHLLVAVAGLK